MSGCTGEVLFYRLAAWFFTDRRDRKSRRADCVQIEKSTAPPIERKKQDEKNTKAALQR